MCSCEPERVQKFLLKGPIVSARVLADCARRVSCIPDSDSVVNTINSMDKKSLAQVDSILAYTHTVTFLPALILPSLC
jgi:hypothetical protein